MPTVRKELQQAISAIRSRDKRFGRGGFVGVVLGSGLGGVTDSLQDRMDIPYSEIPGFPEPTVKGHHGQICIGELAGTTVVALQGRLHLYEGNSPRQVVHGVRVLARAGADVILLTNSGGGISDELEVGDLMVIDDHINLTGRNPLEGPNEDELGPRFPDMTRTWDPVVTQALFDAGKRVKAPMKRGVYVGVLGPSYETPAEIRMMATIGADSVGMSTVLEAIAIRQMGTRLAGVSVISNAAAGMGGEGQTLSHEEVGEVGSQAGTRFQQVLMAFLEGKGSEWATN